MDYQADAITVLTNDEFMMLLAAAGLGQWYGIGMAQQEAGSGDDRLMNRTLASLYQKGLVDWNDGRAAVADGFRPVLRVLRDAGYCVLVKTESRPDRVMSCYPDRGDVVTVERRTASEGELEIHLLSAAEWAEDIEASGCFPVTAGEPGGDEAAAPVELFSSFELRSVPEGRLLQAVRIYEQGLYAVMETEDAGGVRKDWFRLEAARGMLRELIGGLA